MKHFDKYFFGILMGTAFPFLFGLLSIALWFYVDRSENHVVIYLISGLILGLIVDVCCLCKWIKNLYNLPTHLLFTFYILYNIGVYGFFMGFPVFNAFLGLIAGYYYGKRICHNNEKQETRLKLTKKIPLITGLIMAIFCVPTGFLAFEGNGVGQELQSIFGLNFPVTNLMIWGIIIIGGLSLIIVQVLFTRFAIKRTIKNNTR